LGPIEDIPTQNVTGHRSGGGYGWDYDYNIRFDTLEIYTQLRINLTGATASQSLRNTWETTTEQTWGLKFDIIDSGFYHYHVNFNLVLGYGLSNAHYNVNVISGTGSGNMLNWYTTSAWGSAYNGKDVAHEVGHMIGLYDEYSGGAINNANPIYDSTSIMGSLAGATKKRHYEFPFLQWLQGNAPNHLLEIGAYDPDWVIPEPGTLGLLAVGTLALVRKRKR
jgi:hypothetical protein